MDCLQCTIQTYMFLSFTVGSMLGGGLANFDCDEVVDAHCGTEAIFTCNATKLLTSIEVTNNLMKVITKLPMDDSEEGKTKLSDDRKIQIKVAKTKMTVHVKIYNVSIVDSNIYSLRMITKQGHQDHNILLKFYDACDPKIYLGSERGEYVCKAEWSRPGTIHWLDSEGMELAEMNNTKFISGGVPYMSSSVRLQVMDAKMQVCCSVTQKGVTHPGKSCISLDNESPLANLTTGQSSSSAAGMKKSIPIFAILTMIIIPSISIFLVYILKKRLVVQRQRVRRISEGPLMGESFSEDV